MNKNLTRRDLMAISAAAASGMLFLPGCNSPETDDSPPESQAAVPPKRSDQLLHLSPYVLRLKKWEAGDLFTFTNAMEMKELKSLCRSLEIEQNDQLSKPALLEKIHSEILWQCSNTIMYPFKNVEKIKYHDIVEWCAGKVGIDSTTARFSSTFDLEQEIVKRQFTELWDKLSQAQRLELLEKIDAEHSLQDHAAIAGMSGAAALATLSTTVYFSGFAFYTTMSVVISTVAGFFGVTLPFAAYTTASTTVAVLAGPVGWALGAVLLAASVAWTGRANVVKTTATVMQLHALKAGALYCNEEM